MEGTNKTTRVKPSDYVPSQPKQAMRIRRIETMALVPSKRQGYALGAFYWKDWKASSRSASTRASPRSRIFWMLRAGIPSGSG